MEEFAETYVENAIRLPHEYELFYSQARWLSPPRGSGRPRPIRDSRPNFAFMEGMLAKQLGGSAEQHTTLALAIWSTLHGTAMLLLTRGIPDGHDEELRSACRTAVKTLIAGARRFPQTPEEREHLARTEPSRSEMLPR